MRAYGIEIPSKDPTDIEVELYAYRHGGNLGPKLHFQNICKILWGPDNPYGAEFVWTPLAVRMLEECLKNDWVTLSGGTGCGKTRFAAIWAIVNFIADPFNTQVICLSTTIEQAKGRIWGSVEYYFLNAKYPLPGKVLGKHVRISDGTTKRFPSDRGIFLIGAEKKAGPDAAKQMIGFHCNYVYVIADELPELSESVVTASKSNLASNPNFSFIGLGNHKNANDAFGKVSRPKDGWESVTVDDDLWETEYGICLHFDALKHPNYLAKKNIWPGTPWEKIQEAVDTMDETSAEFWRMWRSFPCPSGDAHTLYSEMDIEIYGGGLDTVWMRPPTPIMSLDPAFTNDGDSAIAYPGWIGTDREGKLVLLYGKEIAIREDATNKTDTRHRQISRKFVEAARKHGVAGAHHAAVDTSGGGTVLADMICEEWEDKRLLRVDFGGSPSEIPVGQFQQAPASEKFDNRVSELWGAGIDFLRCGQLKGIGSEMAVQMSSRLYETVKGNGTLKIRVEPKKKFKVRLRQSPDEADAGFILLDLCRQRFSFRPHGSEFKRKEVKHSEMRFKIRESAKKERPVLKTLGKGGWGRSIIQIR